MEGQHFIARWQEGTESGSVPSCLLVSCCSLLPWLFCFIVQPIEQGDGFICSCEGECAQYTAIARCLPEARVVVVQQSWLLFERAGTDACLGTDGFSQSLERDPFGFSGDQ